MIKRVVLACAFAAGTAWAALDVDALWNFNDLAASEARFREALIDASGDDAQRASDPRGQGWQAAAHNNIGSDLREAERHDDSLAAFRDALAAYERSGRAEQVRIARWQIANVLRLKAQRDEALAMQLALERDASSAGAPDPYVYDELALLHRAAGNEKLADDAEQRARQLRKP